MWFQFFPNSAYIECRALQQVCPMVCGEQICLLGKHISAVTCPTGKRVWKFSWRVWLNFVYFKIASGKENGSASCPKVELTFFLYLSSPGKACLKSSMSLQFQLTGSLYLYAGQVSAILAHTRELHIRTDPRANTWHWRSDGLQDPHILGTKGWFTLYPYY